MLPKDPPAGTLRLILSRAEFKDPLSTVYKDDNRFFSQRLS